MALAEANRFIAGCQQFCNIETGLFDVAAEVVTGVNDVTSSVLG